MKFILHFVLLLVGATSMMAQSYQYKPTPYTQPFVQTIFDAASARTYLGVTNGASPTNTALLNGTNVFTGTNTLNAATLFTSGALSRVLVRTNLTWTNNVTGSASTPAAWANCAQVATITMPPLYGTNSIVRITMLRGVNTTVAASTYPVFYAGSSPAFVEIGRAHV